MVDVQRRSLLERIGRVFFIWRNWIFTPVLLGFLIGARPVPFLGRPAADFWLDLAGFAVTLAGQAVRIAVIGCSTIDSGGTRRRPAANSLVTVGLLAHVRNPLYVGNFLVVTGLALIHNNPWAYLLGLPVVCFAYRGIVAAEEVFLAGRFGEEYAEYCRRVPRWLPNPRGLRRSFHGVRFDLRRVVLQEYGSMYLAVGLPLALLLYEALLWPGSPQRAGVGVLWALFFLAAAAWGWGRRVKLEAVARRRAQEAAVAEPNADGTAAVP